MGEKLRLLTIGTIVSVLVALTSVLATAYVGNFATKSEVEKERSQRENDVSLVKKDIQYIKDGIKEIKEILKKK